MFDIADEEIATIAALLEGRAEAEADQQAATVRSRRSKSRKKLASAARALERLSPEERAEVEAEALALLSPADRVALEDQSERAFGLWRKRAGRLARLRLAAAQVPA